MKAAHVTHHRAAHHDVVEVSHHGNKWRERHVNGQRGEEQAGPIQPMVKSPMKPMA